MGIVSSDSLGGFMSLSLVSVIERGRESVPCERWDRRNRFRVQRGQCRQDMRGEWKDYPNFLSVVAVPFRHDSGKRDLSFLTSSRSILQQHFSTSLNPNPYTRLMRFTSQGKPFPRPSQVKSIKVVFIYGGGKTVSIVVM